MDKINYFLSAVLIFAFILISCSESEPNKGVFESISESKGVEVKYHATLIDITVDEHGRSEAYIDVDGDSFPDFVFDIPLKYKTLLPPGVTLNVIGYRISGDKDEKPCRLIDVGLSIAM